MGGRKARKRGAGRNREAHLDKEDLLRYVRKSADRGTNFRHILEDFNVAPAARKQIRDILNQLVKEGKLAKHRGSRYEASPQSGRRNDSRPSRWIWICHSEGENSRHRERHLYTGRFDRTRNEWRQRQSRNHAAQARRQSRRPSRERRKESAKHHRRPAAIRRTGFLRRAGR